MTEYCLPTIAVECSAISNAERKERRTGQQPIFIYIFIIKQLPKRPLPEWSFNELALNKMCTIRLVLRGQV